MLRRLLTALFVVALVAGGYILLSPQGRQLIDRVHVNLDRAEHKARHRAGQKLRGTPDLARLDQRLAAAGVAPGVPVHIRIYKLESELELWVENDGRYELFATYPICLWSGRLGPKLREGDRQAPEGFYTVDKDALNPNSRMHLSFNLGFPNVYDRVHGRTGSFLMVHGGCASIGCYAVTDRIVDEIWLFVTKALDNGQTRIPVHAFPFRMTERALWLRRGDKWAGFWTNLKQGHDLFEKRRVPPNVSVCGRRYVFEPGSLATVANEVEERCPPEVASNP
ncbi:MAG: L,D-transpeptidase family protein [Methyloceanibacter sp.]|uniref:L,D-transpeptidase family protein n=1 Tax=Methyloceanibacter sp. TaxID=1965321 RepID=UPI003D6CF9BB